MNVAPRLNARINVRTAVELSGLGTTNEDCFKKAFFHRFRELSSVKHKKVVSACCLGVLIARSPPFYIPPDAVALCGCHLISTKHGVHSKYHFGIPISLYELFNKIFPAFPQHLLLQGVNFCRRLRRGGRKE
ncbi:hypothetical protein CEXT_205941 [Caerostris extrusa]|uniref:Uncharacterized protein n=1 Tax=Caerostris extrusa TaxID=172846 RepID=A0AAV4TNE5_CAEEX|nr:hypothetical protein CEXT_205941 [Caerostris extrusa]